MPKIRHLWSFIVAVIAGLIAGCERPVYAAPGQDFPVPVLKYIGVIPVQTKGTAIGEDRQQMLMSVFSQVVRDANRFQVLNDEVVGELWSHAPGRAELKQTYELHGFVSLRVVERDDAVVMVSRLLSPNLENYLVESEVVARSWFFGADAGRLKERLERLVFRLLNRLPMDVSVTSVQGPYITLSGGEEYGIRTGDALTFQRYTVTALHPANKSWIKFGTKKLGSAKVIEVKKHTAVAEITDLSYKGAIKIGDGARIPAVATRKKFQREEQGPRYETPKGSVIVSPLAADGSRSAQTSPAPVTKNDTAPSPRTETAIKDLTSRQPAAQAAKQVEESPATAPSEAPKDEARQEDKTETATEVTSASPGLLDAIGQKFKTLTFSFGPRLWGASGSASAGAGLPLWVVNHGEATLTGPITQDVMVDYRLNLDYGPTGKGSFFGFGVRGDVYYQMASGSIISGTDNLNIGVLFQYQSLGVDGESFGGLDVFGIGGFAGITGKAKFGDLQENIAWDARFMMIPQASGQLGTKGKKRDVTGVFNYRLSVEGILEGQPKTWEWGGSAYYGVDDYGLSSGAISISDLYVGALTRYRF